MSLDEDNLRRIKQLGAEAVTHAASSSVHHAPVTVSAPIVLTGQAIELKNDANAQVTAIEAGAPTNSATKLPSSASLYSHATDTTLHPNADYLLPDSTNYGRYVLCLPYYNPGNVYYDDWVINGDVSIWSNYATSGATRLYLKIDLPKTSKGGNLYIKSFSIVISDADANDYVDEIYFDTFDYSGGSFSRVYSNTTNYNSAQTVTCDCTDTDISSKDAYILIIGQQNAQYDLDLHVEVNYYYA